MKTVVLGPPPAELERLIEHRHALGLDIFDEIWGGTYHMAPAPHPHHGYLDSQLARILRPYADAASLVETGPFNLGEPGDYRVPDHGYHRELPGAAFVATAAVVTEVVSPDDETYDKLPFYARHEVDEVLVVEPDARQVRILALADGRYDDAETSKALGVRASELQEAIRWP